MKTKSQNHSSKKILFELQLKPAIPMMIAG